MIENRNVNIITDADGKKLVLINDIRFKGKRQFNWDDVKQDLEGYVGDYYEIEENAERIFIGNELPEKYAESESKNAKYGWYRYDVRFALPIYEENVLVRYNIFHARLLVNHAESDRKYLYDILAIKKETSKP